MSQAVRSNKVGKWLCHGTDGNSAQRKKKRTFTFLDNDEKMSQAVRSSRVAGSMCHEIDCVLDRNAGASYLIRQRHPEISLRYQQRTTNSRVLHVCTMYINKNKKYSRLECCITVIKK